tara:strand:- start:395 stop:523 length:129 start_codon:yes stop_codon:yes gene_type:complete
MKDTLQYVVAQVSLGTSTFFWGLAIFTSIIIAMIIAGGLSDD